MPYKGVASKDTVKVEQCIANLIRGGKDKASAHAICIKQFQTKSMSIIKRRKTVRAAQPLIKVTKNCPLDNIRSFATFTVFASETGKIKEEIPVLLFGEVDSPLVGKFTFTREIGQMMVDNFKKNVTGIGVPVNEDHPIVRGASTGATGWGKDLYLKDDGMYCTIDWNSIGERLLADKIYKGVSPEFNFNWQHTETGEMCGPTLIALSMTNAPVLKKSLGSALVASEHLYINRAGVKQPVLLAVNNHAMPISKIEAAPVDVTIKAAEIADIVVMAPADLTDDMKAMLMEHWDELTEEQQAKFKAVYDSMMAAKTAGATVKASEEAVAPEPKAEEKPAEKVAEPVPTPPVEAKAESVTVAASEYAALKLKADAASKAETALRRIKSDQKVDATYRLSETAGLFMPKGIDPLKNVMFYLSEHAPDMLAELEKSFAAIPSKHMALSEIGSAVRGKTSTASAKERFDKEVKEAAAKNTHLSEVAVMRQVIRQNPDLVQEIYATDEDPK